MTTFDEARKALMELGDAGDTVARALEGWGVYTALGQDDKRDVFVEYLEMATLMRGWATSEEPEDLWERTAAWAERASTIGGGVP